MSYDLPIKIRDNIWRVTEFITAVVCGIVAYYSIKFIQYEYQDGLIAFANVPVWLCETIIPVAFIVMALRYFVYAVTPHHLLSPEPCDTNPPSEFN